MAARPLEPLGSARALHPGKLDYCIWFAEKLFVHILSFCGYVDIGEIYEMGIELVISYVC